MQEISLEKRLEKKRNSSYSLSIHHTSRWIVLQNGVTDSSILLEIFHLYQNIYHSKEKKQSRYEIKRMGSCYLPVYLA